jgi:hypothetical protein
LTSPAWTNVTAKIAISKVTNFFFMRAAPD